MFASLVETCLRRLKQPVKLGWKPRRSSISPEAFGVSCKSQPRTAFPSLSQRWKSHGAASHFLLSCVQRLCSLEGRGALCREEAIAQPAGSWLGWERALASPRPPCYVVIFIPRKRKSGRAVQQNLSGAGGRVSRSPGNDGAGLGIPSTSGQLERTVNHPSGPRAQLLGTMQGREKYRREASDRTAATSGAKLVDSPGKRGPTALGLLLLRPVQGAELLGEMPVLSGCLCRQCGRLCLGGGSLFVPWPCPPPASKSSSVSWAFSAASSVTRRPWWTTTRPLGFPLWSGASEAPLAGPGGP